MVLYCISDYNAFNGALYNGAPSSCCLLIDQLTVYNIIIKVTTWLVSVTDERKWEAERLEST